MHIKTGPWSQGAVRHGNRNTAPASWHANCKRILLRLSGRHNTAPSRIHSIALHSLFAVACVKVLPEDCEPTSLFKRGVNVLISLPRNCVPCCGKSQADCMSQYAAFGVRWAEVPNSRQSHTLHGHASLFGWSSLCQLGCQSSFVGPDPARSRPSKPNGWFVPSKSWASELPKAVKTAAPVTKKPMAGANSARGQEPVAS